MNSLCQDLSVGTTFLYASDKTIVTDNRLWIGETSRLRLIDCNFDKSIIPEGIAKT